MRWGAEEILEERRVKSCDVCGRDLPEWRQRYSAMCSECGLPRCKGCGAPVGEQDYTMDGGLCPTCAPSGSRVL